MRQIPAATARFLPICLLVFLILGQVPAFAWGNAGHTSVNLDAAQRIPKSMPAFLRSRAAISQIEYLGPEPDRWRAVVDSALNTAQAPDHFINLERIQGLGELPKGRYDFYRLLYAKRAATATHSDDYLPENVGLLPYITIEIYQRLKVAFQNYRALQAAKQPTDAVERDIVFYAGWLGHYVADGSQPLHTSVNYDGWVEENPQGFTTEHGIHRKFETDFVAQNIKAGDFAPLMGAPHQLADPSADFQQYLRNSHALVPKVYELEKAQAFDGAGTPESIQFVKERLAAGATMLRDLWYTAWMESAQ